MAEKVSEVRDDPVLARLGEPVVIHGREVALEQDRLVRDDGKELAKRTAARQVTLPDVGGEQRVQRFPSVDHDRRPCTMLRTSVSSTLGTRKASCAGRMRGRLPSTRGI